MKKHFFLLSLLLSFTIGIGQVWAEDVVYKTALFGSSYNSKSVSGYTNVSFDATNDGFKVNVANANNNNNGWAYIKIGGKNGDYTGTIITDAAIDKAITKVDLTIDALTAKNVTSITLYTSTDKSTWASAGTFDKSTGAKSVTLTSPTSNLYYKIEVVCTKGSSNGLITISKVEYYIDNASSGGGDPTPTPSLTISPTTIDFGTVEQGAEVAAKEVTVNFANLTGSVAYSGLSGVFAATGTISSTGNKITITPSTSTIGEYSQTLTVQSSSDNLTQDVTVTMNVVEPFDGMKLTFDVSSNPGEWPTANDASLTNYTYSLDDVDYTFAIKNAKCNTGYLMLTQPAVLGLPAISGYKLVKIEANNSSSCSTSTKVKVTSDGAGSTVVSGGAEQTWGTVSSTYTYTLSGTSGNTMYYLIVSNKNCQLTGLTLYYEEAVAPAVEIPTISGTENFVTSTEVTLECTTDGASIYYTTDGSTPTSSSTAYTAPFTLNASAIVKAIAIKAGTSSEVASKAFTKIEALTTMDAIFAAATAAGNNAADHYITFNNWIVSGSKGNTAYITDGTKGFIIYYSNHGFAEGDILSGTASFKLKLYNGAAEITAKNSGTVTITKGGAATLNELNEEDITALTGINTGSLIKVSGECTSENSKYYIAGVQLYTTLFSYTAPSAGKNYNCTGVYVQYNSTKEMMPRSANDIEEIVEEGAPETPTFSPAAGTYTSVQSVEISCTTEDATIYYTTDGTTPTSASTQYTTAISVEETMTIKAIAIKNEQSSAMATAAYTINLPVDESTAKEWNLAIDETATASTSELTWTATYVDMSYAKGTSTSNANNYYPSTPNQTYTSTRFYKNGVLTITPKNKRITTITFAATTPNYATALANSTWTNGTAQADGSNVVVTASGSGAVSATIGATCGFSGVRVDYIDVDASIPADPTFSPVAGTYTEVQSVEISCTTEGATIYYTTDGTNPTQESTEYTEAISVGEDMTIKAIAIKESKSSSVVTAAYTINLPEDEETSKTWDLSDVSCDNNPTDNLMEWTATYVKMSIAKGSGTKVTNYYPGTTGQSYKSTRFYKDNTLTFTPNGKQITNITFVATSSSYATALAASTWTNGTAQADGSNVVVTVGNSGVVSAAITGTCGFTSIRVAYKNIDASVPATPTFSPAAGTYTSAQSVEISCATEGVTIYYTTDGSTPDNTKTEYKTAISVEETMTIKAIAIKENKSSSVVSATYTINIPELPEGCDGADDFDSDESGTAVSTYGNRSTTSGWTATNAQWTTISEEKCYFTINGKTTAVGDITSPTLHNGIASLKFNYANMSAETSGVKVKVEIKQGATVAKEYTITKANADVTKETVYTETIENINVAGDFQIVITNLCPTNSTSNKDRVSIGKLCWTNYSAPVDPTPDPEPIYTEVRSGLETNRFYTACLDRKVTAVRGASFWRISKRNAAGTMAYLEEMAAPIAAGTPFIYFTNATTFEVVYEGVAVTTPVENGALRGTLTGMNAEQLAEAGSGIYLMYQNALHPLGTNNHLDANRAYLVYGALESVNEEPVSAPGRRVRSMPMQGNVATGIEAIFQMSNGNENACKVMIDGQLFILRGEKLYDTTGRLVK